jgi:hypothetical protein
VRTVDLFCGQCGTGVLREQDLRHMRTEEDNPTIPLLFGQINYSLIYGLCQIMMQNLFRVDFYISIYFNLVYTWSMAKRDAVNTKNKTSRSHKTKKRLAIKNARIALHKKGKTKVKKA